MLRSYDLFQIVYPILYFTDQHFEAFYRFISNIDMELHFKNQAFSGSGQQFTDQTSYVNNFSIELDKSFCAWSYFATFVSLLEVLWANPKPSKVILPSRSTKAIINHLAKSIENFTLSYIIVSWQLGISAEYVEMVNLVMSAQNLSILEIQNLYELYSLWMAFTYIVIAVRWW